MVRRVKDRKSAGSRDWRHRSQRRLRFETLEARELLSATTSVGSAAVTRSVLASTALPATTTTATITTSKTTITTSTTATTTTSSTLTAAAVTYNQAYFNAFAKVPVSAAKTAAYIANFNPATYIAQGTDFTNFNYTLAGAAAGWGSRPARSTSRTITILPSWRRSRTN